MSDFRIAARRGASIGFEFIVTRPDALGVEQPVDLTAAGVRLDVTGKLRPGDATPVFAKSWQQGGPAGGVTVDPTPPANIAVCDLPPDEAGIVALAQTCYVMVDAILTEGSGRKTRVATGVIKVRVGPGS